MNLYTVILLTPNGELSIPGVLARDETAAIERAIEIASVDHYEVWQVRNEYVHFARL